MQHDGRSRNKSRSRSRQSEAYGDELLFFFRPWLRRARSDAIDQSQAGAVRRLAGPGWPNRTPNTGKLSHMGHQMNTTYQYLAQHACCTAAQV